MGIHGEEVRPSLRACRARPSAGLVTGAGMASGWKARGYARADFLEGTRSARPDCKASRMARTFISAGG